MRESGESRNNLFGSASGWILLGFLAIAGFYLVTEHRAHLFGVLPFVLLLLCPLLHMFHGGHGGHAGHRSDPTSRDPEHRHAPREDRP